MLTSRYLILPQYLNILNDAKYPVDSLEIQKMPKVKNNILHVNPMAKKFFVNKDIIQIFIIYFCDMNLFCFYCN